jgi:hypothetical protein
LRAVVGHDEQDRVRWVIDAGVHQGVLVGHHHLVEAFQAQRVGERLRDLNAGLLDRDDFGEPLARHQVHDRHHRHPGGGEMCRVIDPDAVGGVLGPGRERLAGRASRPGQGAEAKSLCGKDFTHRGG